MVTTVSRRTSTLFSSESSFVEETSTTDDLTDEAEGATFSDDTDDLLDGLV